MIKIAVLVNKAEEPVNTIQMLGFINDIVDVEIATPDPIKLSVINNNTLFFSNFSTFSYNIRCQF